MALTEIVWRKWLISIFLFLGLQFKTKVSRIALARPYQDGGGFGQINDGGGHDAARPAVDDQLQRVLQFGAYLFRIVQRCSAIGKDQRRRKQRLSEFLEQC